MLVSSLKLNLLFNSPPLNTTKTARTFETTKTKTKEANSQEITLTKPSSNFRKPVKKTLVSKSHPLLFRLTERILLDFADAFYERGKCYMDMQDFKRALYDYSAAIRAESKLAKASKTNNNLAKYFCKSIHSPQRV